MSLSFHECSFNDYLLYIVDELLSSYDFLMTVGAFILIMVGMDLMGAFVLGIDIIYTFTITILLLVRAYKDGAGNVVTYPGQIIK